MICTSCKKTVKDGTSICPHCDAILDDSILGAVPDGDDSVDDTPPPAPKPKAKPKAPTTNMRKPARRPAPISEPDPEPEAEPKDEAPSFQDGKYKNKYSQYWTEEDGDKPAKPAKVAAPPAREGGLSVPDPEEDGPPGPSDAPSDPLLFLKDAWAGFLALHFEDKLTVSACAGAILATFMPWRSTTEGDEMGLLSTGLFTFLLDVVGITSVWARKVGKVPSLPRGRFPLAAIAAGGLSALFCIVAGITSYERGVVAGKTTVVSEPAFGVFLALIAAAGIVVGGVLTQKREK